MSFSSDSLFKVQSDVKEFKPYKVYYINQPWVDREASYYDIDVIFKVEIQ